MPQTAGRSKQSQTRLNLAEYLAQAEAAILPRHLSEQSQPVNIAADEKLRVGVDLGTAYLVLAVTNENGAVLAGEWQFAEVVRDGLVVDFIGATDLLRGMKDRLERRIGRELTHAASGYPPGVPQIEVRATAHVIEATGMECSGLIDEPTAANNVLLLREGAIVDVGGGTTGIAILHKGQVIYSADEPTGGTHFSLVIAGALDISFSEAEALKTTLSEQPRLLPVVRPVMEKVASIIERHIRGRKISMITMVGGSSAFLGMADVVQDYLGIPTQVVCNPLFVTPLGLALHDPAQ
ncbi:MAG: ethanolamine utilization protein EutJ [Anaerolineales bacterium]|nr:ethanolamine utilization protein EutJ [Anaerolineales bacterium]